MTKISVRLLSVQDSLSVEIAWVLLERWPELTFLHFPSQGRWSTRLTRRVGVCGNCTLQARSAIVKVYIFKTGSKKDSRNWNKSTLLKLNLTPRHTYFLESWECHIHATFSDSCPKKLWVLLAASADCGAGDVGALPATVQHVLNYVLQFTFPLNHYFLIFSHALCFKCIVQSAFFPRVF